MAETMKAWVLDDAHQPLRLEERPVPTAGPGQVVIKVKASGLCHSDVGYMEGVIPFMTDLPVVLGHEVAGVVTELGEGVSGYAVGDAVVGAVSGDDAPGVTRDGAYAEYTILTADKLVKLPEGIDMAQAAAATDAGATSHAGVVVYGKVKEGDKVLIIGLGGLGMTGARIAVLKGAEVVGVEPREDIWDAAKELGVKEVYKDASELEGQDFDVAVDFAGFGTTTQAAIKAVKYNGRVSLIGLGRTQFEFNSYDLISRAITLQGATPRGRVEDLQEVIDWVGAGDLKITTTNTTFDKIPEGLQQLAEGKVQGRLVAIFED
ncbi:zinc-binding dehydrogenase [Gulosibacter molinativorax]|uniref:alcohol dehydrogenase n=1 Tax=Gulosibacter molinativorax TaxID=256821 RepID=A0ABT7C9G6_9MICO|nr:zinc-binding dehydrogenase [Gulosibacter molinativorax]MDJ1371861.1 alcohol dehydrogenase [Gulosibacter molinativorax]QUY62510.1 Alcohol dehydrogenase [Gulosibacter molinativorax]